MSDELIPEQVEATEKIYQGRVIAVERLRVRLPGGREAAREVVRHPDSAAAVVLNAKNEVLLVRQFRQAAGQALWEVPAGKLDPGETPEEAVRREVAEETGCRMDRVEKLAEFYPSPGILTEKMHLFLASVASEGAARPDTDEVITSRWVPWNEVKEWMAQGKIRDAKSLVGILLAAKHLPFAP